VKGKNIFIVEDDPISLIKLKNDLTNLGITVFACDNSITGLSILNSGKHVDMLITDLKLPYNTGVNFIKEVRGVYKKLPILVISGTVNPENIKIIKHYKCHDIMVKPYDRDRLEVILADIFDD